METSISKRKPRLFLITSINTDEQLTTPMLNRQSINYQSMFYKNMTYS